MTANKMIDIDNFEKIKEIQISIEKHKDFSLISKDYAQGLWEMYTSNSSFFNYFLKKERVITFNLLMSYILSDGIASLSEFYALCGEKKFSGKNNAISFVDYMVHSGRVVFIKGNDRRRKTPALTEKGRKDLDYLFLKKLTPLSIYDSTIDCNLLLTDDFYRNYYSKHSLTMFMSWRDDLDLTFFDKQHLLNIQSKSAGLILLMKILLDVRSGEVSAENRGKGSYFKSLSSQLGASPSHTLNLIGLLVEGGLVEKVGVDYIIKDELVVGIEHIISLNLAINYYLIKRKA